MAVEVKCATLEKTMAAIVETNCKALKKDQVKIGKIIEDFLDQAKKELYLTLEN